MKNFVDVNKEFITFIKKNLHEDPCGLRLRETGKPHPFDIRLAIDQIEARRKTRSKLPSFLEHEDFIFPDVLVAEQSTHENVARYNATVAGTGRLTVDMTAGLGIDAFAFASGGNRVIAVEMDKRRSRMLAHNTHALGLESRMRVVNADSLQLLPKLKAMCRRKDSDMKEPVLFLDPARRGAGNSRTYFLEDCVPDVTACLPLLYSCATDILVKASPVLDIARAKSQLSGLREAHVVSVGGEVKEVLLCLRRGHEGEVMLKAVDLCGAGSGVMERYSHALPISETGDREAPVAGDIAVLESGYLYDPLPALRKLHAGGSLCRRFSGLERVSQNTDLYVSRELHEDFPGRIFKLEGIIEGKGLKALRRTGMSVISRNHPLSAEMIRKKYALAESERSFLIAMRYGIKEEGVFVKGERFKG